MRGSATSGRARGGRISEVVKAGQQQRIRPWNLPSPDGPTLADGLDWHQTGPGPHPGIVIRPSNPQNRKPLEGR
jgi:hypothetical protein